MLKFGSMFRSNNKGYAPTVGLNKNPPVTPFKFNAGVLGPKSLPGNGQR